MTDAERYRRRVDQAEFRARECLEKIGFKPQSQATYEMQHDWAIAEMFFNDAMARAATRDPDNMAREMAQFEQRITTEHASSTAIDPERFLDHLKMLVGNYLKSGD